MGARGGTELPRREGVSPQIASLSSLSGKMRGERAKSKTPEPQSDRSSSDHQCSDALVAAHLGHPSCLIRMSPDQVLVKDELGETAMHKAARARDFQSAKLLLEKAPILREVTSLSGESPAHIAVAVGDERIVELLLSGRLKDTLRAAMIRDINGTSVLIASVARGNNNLALWLLKRFGKDLASLPNNCQMTALHVAAAQANLEYIKDATRLDPKSVDARDAFGCTPCAYAVQGGNIDVVRYFVEKAHAEMGSVSRRGQSLLHIASLCGHEHIVRWILNRAGNNVILWPTLDNANAVHCAAYSGSVPVLRLLLRPWSRKKRKAVLAKQDCRGNTPLHLAAMNDHADAVVYLLESDANPLAVNACGYSPQAIANMRGNPQMAAFIAGFNAKNPQPISQRTPLTVETQSFPAERSTTVPLSPVIKRTMSPRDSSSGYSSNAEYYMESPIDRAEVVRQRMQYVEDHPSSYQTSSPRSEIELEDDGAEVIRRRMRYVEDDTSSLKDSAAQTDRDSLVDHIKVLDDETWAGMGLSAVEHIDRVLEEVDLN
ncbi:unnamed protein product [Cylicocyclus nassatus]|uniref:Uncharacterized protein n=1 Tax=Cylicocyclus nassatus TaxID=53992 RepID=A0AA36H2P5_CYLNA|nr:unnamed protein product [Cylicocyclus nassatus]